MPGPTPKPPGQKRRRNASPGFTQIDPSPRTEPAPDWPIAPNALPEYQALEDRRWEELWALPQAREWERMQCYVTVAIYVRLEVRIATDMPDPRLMSELRQLDMTIGVSPKAMLGLRWEIPQQLDDDLKPAATLQSVGGQRAYVPAAAG